MTRIYLALALSALLAARAGAAPLVEHGTLTYDNIPTVSSGLVDALARYLGARQATPLGWSPKGQLLITTRFGDVPQLHAVDGAGGARRQLTFQREPITEAAYSPDPGRNAYVYLEDVGGNENAQLYYQRDGETAKLLTDGKSRNGSPVWSNNGHSVAFFSTARDPASVDVDVVEPDSGALPRLAVTADGPGAQWTPLDWSPDDRQLLVLKTVASDEAHLYVVDLGTGQKKEVDPAPNKVMIIGGKFSRDGQGVYYISDRDSEFLRLRYASFFSNERTVISAGLSWDVEELSISRDGHYLAYVSNEGGAARLNLLDLRSHQDLAPPRLPAGTIGSLRFDAEGQRLAFAYASPDQPGDAFVLDVARNRLEPWTRSEAGDVDLKKFVAPRLEQVPTFDRIDGKPRLMPVYIYEPAGGGSHPVLLELHGGPEAQFRPGFSPWLEFVVNELGYAVVAPNVRGSSGYGKSYMALDNGTLREDAVKDVGALLVYLSLQSGFDAKHIVVSGGSSYGGYLSLAAMVNYGDRLRGGVDVAGIADFVTFLGGTAPYRRNQRRAEYGDERDPDMRAYLRRISPLTNADRITKPLFVVHGKNDPRVPVAEAEQLVNRLRLKGGEVWYLLAADEGHAYRKKQNRDAYYAVFAQFLTAMRQ